MRVLVTGAAGFVGRALVRQLRAEGMEVVGTDITQVASSDGVDERGARDPVELDVTDVASFEAAVEGMDAIVHAAAVTPGELEPARWARRVLDVNLGGTINALEAARRRGVRRLLFVSSAAVYPQEKPRPVSEADATGGDSMYGAAKLAAEVLIRRYGVDFGLDVGIVRPSAVYGPGERPSPSRPTVTPISRLLDAARAGRPVAVRGLPSLRDWIYADDLAHACSLLLRGGMENRVFTVSAGSPVAFSEIVRAVQEATDLEVRRHAAEVVDGGQSKPAVLVNDALRTATGWEPRSIAQGIRASLGEWEAA